MDAKEDQFTQRMLRRASAKLKENDQATNFTSLRRLSILQAIEDNQLPSGRLTGNMDEDEKPEKGCTSQFVKHSTGAVKKNFTRKSTASAKVDTPFLEGIESSSSMTEEFKENITTKNEFHSERNSEFLRKKEEEILIKEKRTQAKIPTQFQESYHPQSMPDSKQVPIKDAMLNFIQNMQSNEASNPENVPTTWESTLAKCISSYSAKFESETHNIPNTSTADSKNVFSSDKNTSFYLHKTESEQLKFPQKHLSFPKDNQTYEKNDAFCPELKPPIPRDYLNCNNMDLESSITNRLNADTPYELKERDSEFPYANITSPSERSLDSFMREFEFQEEKIRRLCQFEDWKDPSEIFRKDLQERTTLHHNTTPLGQNVKNSKIVQSDSKIKEASPSRQTSNLKTSEELQSEEEEEAEVKTESTFSLSSVIKNLEDEIENINLEPKGEDLKSVKETPKKHLSLTDVNTLSSYTARTLFQKDHENEAREVKKPEESEELEKGEKQKDGLSEVKSSFFKRHSSIFGFKTPKFWRSKPNLESTRKSPSADLTRKMTSTSKVGSTTLSFKNPNSPTKSQKVGQKSPSIFENTIPYEVERFLEEALGEELYNASVNYANMDRRNNTDSNLNTSELLSDDISPPRQNQLPKTSNSEPSKYSTLNRTLSAYKSMSQRFKKKFRPSLKDSGVKQTRSPCFLKNIRADDKLKQLLQQFSIQQTLIYQASKALDYCRSMKEFEHSSEQVEINRLILLANIRKEAILKAINNLSSKSLTQSSFNDTGEITINNISVFLKEGVSRRERQSEEFVEWFLVVISQGLTVWATHVTNCPINSPKMYFPGSLSIPNLTSDFKINLKIYSLKIQNIRFSHEEKYRIKVDERHKVCPSPTKLLMRTEKPLSPKIHEVKFSGMRDSSFVLMGVLILQLRDLTMASPWALSSVPNDSVLFGTLDLTVECKLHLSISHTGFLTHGDEAGGLATWNRRWCVLQGFNLMFWNYPREEEIKSPLLIINLKDCVSGLISSIDRSYCARPRTFLIEISRHKNTKDRNSIVLECDPDAKIVKHLLQCDTTHDLIEWMTKLNHVLSVLHEWNLIEKFPKSRETSLEKSKK